jgi:hypothetical protein
MKKLKLKSHSLFFIFTFLFIGLFLFSGCELAFLGLEEEGLAAGLGEGLGESMASAELLTDVGVEVESVSGRLIIAEDEAAFNGKLENIKLNESNELYMMKNGKPKVFAEMIDEETIKLTESPFKNVNLGGKLYTVRGSNVYVRSSPLYDVSNSNWTGTSYNTGRLVMVVGEENGFFQIPLYPGKVGYIKKTLLVPVVAGYNYSSNSKSVSNLTAINQHPEKYVANTDFLKKTGYESVIVVITDNDGNYNAEISNRVANVLSSKGYRTTASFFPNDFFQNGEFTQLYSGNVNIMNKYKLKDHANSIFVGMYSMNMRTNQIKQDMKTATFDITVKKINLENQTTEYSDSKNIAGTGWSENEAEQDALNSFIKYLKLNVK